MELDKPQGRIHTEDPTAVAALLREDSADYKPAAPVAMAHQHRTSNLDAPVQRVYVDTPLSVNEDDDHYQFVSTNADDFEGSNDYDEDETPRYNGHTQIEPDPPSGRYEDRSHALSNRDFPPPEDLPETPPAKPQVQYVVRSKPSSSHTSPQHRYPDSAAQKPPYNQHPNANDDGGQPHIVQPIRSPLLPRSQADQDEMRALQQEVEYQQHLRTKLWEQTKQAEQIQIPRLALDQLEDEEKPRRAPMPLHDSLEDEYIVGDSLEERQARSAFYHANKQQAQYSQPSNHDNSGYGNHGGPYNNNQGIVQDSLEFPGNYQQPEYHQNAGHPPGQGYGKPYTDTQSYGYQVNGPPAHGYTEPPGVPAQYYRGKGGDYVNPDDYQSNLNTQQLPYEQANQPTYQIPQNYGTAAQYTPQSEGYVPQGLGNNTHQGQGYLTSDKAYDPNTQNYDPMQQGYDANTQQDDTKHYGNEPESFSEHQHHLVDVDINQNIFSRPIPKVPPKPQKDFVHRNKQALTTTSPKKTYGQIHTTKKIDSKENESPSRVSHRSSKAGGAPKQPSAESEPVSSPNSAEQLWAKRAQRLENQKNVKLSGKSKTSPLHKHSSESRVDRMRDSAATVKSSPGSYQTRAPHHVQPIAQRLPAPQRSLAEPIRSEVTARSGSPNQPITHTIFTEDGQRLSVDINLKVISPTPNKGGVGAPLNSQAPYSTWQQNPAAFRPHKPQGDFGHQGAPLPYQESPYAQLGPAPGTQSDHLEFYPAQGYASPRDDLSSQVTTPQTPMSGSYRVLPPIGSADTENGRSPKTTFLGQTSPKTGGTGYADQYKSQKNHRPDYKEYTLDDYRKLRKEIRLGGLGPDIDSETAREKREKRQRQIEYAKTLKSRQVPMNPGGQPDRLRIDEDEEDTLNRRKVALEYARSVPKPKIRTSPKPPASRNVNANPSRTNNEQPPSYHEPPTRTHHEPPRANHEPELEVFDLKKLQERHERERNQVALIRQNMENISQA